MAVAGREELLAMVEDLVVQATWCTQDGRSFYDSMAISTYADAMRLLAAEGRFVIEKEHGRRVIGHLAEREDDDA